MARILVIDDMIGVRRSIAAILKQSGHDILEADNGQSGTDILDRENVDLVITDMMMPVKDGVAVISHLRNKPQRPKILAISGGSANVNPGSALEVAEKLADRILHKPFQRPQLLDMVDSLIN